MRSLHGLQPFDLHARYRAQRVLVAVDAEHLAATPQDLLRMAGATKRAIHIDAARLHVERVNRLHEHYRDVSASRHRHFAPAFSFFARAASLRFSATARNAVRSSLPVPADGLFSAAHNFAFLIPPTIAIVPVTPA